MLEAQEGVAGGDAEEAAAPPEVGGGQTLATPTTVRAVLDGLFAFAGVLAPDGTLIEANRAALEAAGLRAEDVLGRPFEEAYWWSYDPGVQAGLRDAIKRAAAGERVRYDVQVRLGADRFVVIDFMLAPVRDEEGRVAYLVPSAIDITERKAAEQALRTSEERLRLALRAGQMGTWELDLPTGAVYSGESTDAIFGLPPASGPRSKAEFLARVHPDDVARVHEAIRRTVEDGEEHAIEYRVVQPGGAVRWLASRGECVRDEQGRAVRMLGALFDITAVRQTTEALHESEARYSALAEALPAILFTTRPDGLCDYVSQNFYDFTGLPRGSGEGEGWLPTLHPADQEPTMAAWRTAVATGEAFAIDYRMRRADGAYYWFRVRSTPFRGPDGAVARWFGVCLEVDDAKRAADEREALLASEQEARAQAEQAAARIARLQTVTAALSRVLHPTDVAEVVAQQSLAALAAASSTVRMVDESGAWLTLLTGAGFPQAARERWERVPVSAPFPVAAAIRSGQPVFIESRGALLEAYPHLVDTVAGLGYEALLVAPLLVEGRAIGSLALTFDGPRRFDADDRAFVLALAGQCAQALERARLYGAAQEALAARDSFITVASHDLRTPLTALLGQATLLERRAEQEGAGERILRSARIVAQQARRLNRMIDALLDLSLIQSGRLAVERRPLDLTAVVRRMVEELAPTLTRHALVVEGDDEPAPVSGDEVRLEQVFFNLIGNAVKYSPDGGPVTVRIARRGAQICVDVADQGIGISAEALPHVFERFFRSPGAGGRAVSGAGIGLYVVRELVALHDGAVSVVSDEGAGSTFTVCLPRA